MKEKLKNKRGITLIALVVTIVVILIIAGVSLNLSIGENGVIEKSKLAKMMSRIADVESAIQLESIGQQLNNPNFEKVMLEDLNRKGIVTRRLEENNGKALLRYVINVDKLGINLENGKGDSVGLKDVYCVNEDLTVCYIDEKGKVYGENNALELKEDTVIQFQDKQLQAYIVNRLNLSENKVTYGDIKGIKSLTLHTTGIKSLEDLYFFKGITTLYIYNEKLNSLDGIENCLNLKSVAFSSVWVNDTKALSKLDNVSSLSISFSGIDLNELIPNIKGY